MRNNWSKGLTKETDERIKKISESKKGVSWEEFMGKEKSQKRKHIKSLMMSGNQYAKNPSLEARKWHSLNMQKINKRFWADKNSVFNNQSWRKKRALINKRPKSEETKTKLSIWRTGKSYKEIYGTEMAKEIISRKKRIGKRLWEDKEYRDKIIKAMSIKPSTPERIVIQILKLNKIKFKYTGDLSYFIHGFNPDFMDKQRKKIIEVNSNLHLISEKRIQRDKERYDQLKKLGYKLLIIWERDIKQNPQNITEKIINFFI